ncbi:hypothetical protein DRO02_01405 [archaeon]|nr:MAG: hypothetical protein DRO02_01405 [archaeon]HDM24224.1 hypothetical protein [Candidatus Bathyarchaeota archaeon]
MFPLLYLMTIILVISLIGLLAAKIAESVNIPTTVPLILIGILMRLIVDRLGITELIEFANLFINSGILFIMLVSVLFLSGLETELGDLKRVAKLALMLGTVSVLLTVIFTGVLMYIGLPLLGMEIPFMIALFIGVMIAPTDPASTFIILERTRVRKYIKDVIMNAAAIDDVIVTILATLLTLMLTAETVSLEALVIKAVWMPVGGIAIGVLIAYIFSYLMVYVFKREVELQIASLAALALTFGLAELTDASGPMAAIFAGIIMANSKYFSKYLPVISAKNRRMLLTFWRNIIFFLEAIVFIFLGLSVDIDLLMDVGLLGLLVGAIVLFIAKPLSTLLTTEGFGISPRESFFISWARINLSTSAVLLAFAYAAGEWMQLVINITFLVIVVNTLIQGLTVGKVAKILGLEVAEEDIELVVKREKLLTIIRVISEHRDKGLIDRQLANNIIDEYMSELEMLETQISAKISSLEDTIEGLRARIAALDAAVERLKRLKEADPATSSIVDEEISSILREKRDLESELKRLLVDKRRMEELIGGVHG